MFPAPSHTQVPNVFFDEIISTLNEGELRVILIIIHQLFGDANNSGWMTASFLAKKAGYDKRSIYRIIAKLVARKLIIKNVVKEDGIEKSCYSLNFEYPMNKCQSESNIVIS